MEIRERIRIRVSKRLWRGDNNEDPHTHTASCFETRYLSFGLQPHALVSGALGALGEMFFPLSLEKKKKEEAGLKKRRRQKKATNERAGGARRPRAAPPSLWREKKQRKRNRENAHSQTLPPISKGPLCSSQYRGTRPQVRGGARRLGAHSGRVRSLPPKAPACVLYTTVTEPWSRASWSGLYIRFNLKMCV